MTKEAPGSTLGSTSGEHVLTPIGVFLPQVAQTAGACSSPKDRQASYAEVMATREDLHGLVDALPDDRLAWAALDLAPYDDEPVTAEDRAAMAEAEADWREGRTVPLDRVLAELDDRDHGAAR